MTHETIAFISDIHGNPWALRAVLDTIKIRGIKKVYCGGDIVGWLFRPIECIQMLMDEQASGLLQGVVLGNHDLMALNRFSDEALEGVSDRPETRMSRQLATAFSAGALEHAPLHKQYLEQFGHIRIEGETFLVGHQSPFSWTDKNEGVSAAQYTVFELQLEQELGNWKACSVPVVITGHGHKPELYQFTGHSRGQISAEDILQSKLILPPEERCFRVPIEDGTAYWVRSGSVGGPYSDGVALAHWIEYQPGTCVIFHRTEYDTDPLLEDIREHNHLMTGREMWQRTFVRPIAENQ
jgi:predicted phosphodiesterase